MIRRVAFRKAILAGAAGAAAWEFAARLLILAGLPIFDLVRTLGTMHSPNPSAWLWWPLGLLLHAAIGAVWAIFYAYFFWSNYAWRPLLQGLAFSSVPLTLAGLIMVPQMGWMHPAVLAGILPHPGLFAWRLGWGGPAGIFLGHLIFGAVLGTLYTHPIGAPTGKPLPPIPLRQASRTTRDSLTPDPTPSVSAFMFATGIECSYPTIEKGTWRMDQLADADHYRHWHRDLELVRSLGLRHLRYGPPLHRIWLGPEKYDWSFMDAVARTMQELGIVPIMDLCHFGLPDWLGNSFQNPEFPRHFARYAAAFARRYPWVRYYTPVNEMYVTARNSALEGLWNEQLRSEDAFVTAVRHLVEASHSAMQEILREQPLAIFINSESSEFYQACCPDPEVTRIADFENLRRFITLDLLYGISPGDQVRQYLLDHGLAADHLSRFLTFGREIAPRCILGIDYYEWNEKLINSHGRAESLGELFGWFVITRQYYDRYRRPLMHTETNCQDASKAPDWLLRQWHNVQLMRRSGVPVVGFTWYSLIDQVDWNIGLSQPLGNVNPVGLFDLNRDLRPAGQSCQRLIKMFRDEHLLPGNPSLDLPGLLQQTGGAPLRRSSEPMDMLRAQPSAR